MKFPSSPIPKSGVPVVTELAPRTIVDGSNHDCLSSPNHVTTPALKVKTKEKLRMEENHFESKTEAEEILKNFSPNKNLREKSYIIQEFSTNLYLLLFSLSFGYIKALKLKPTSRPCKFGVFSHIRIKHLSFQEVNIIEWKEKLHEKL